MPRPLVPVLAALLAVAAAAPWFAASGGAQEATETAEAAAPGATGREVLLRAGVRALPEAPASLRLSRTTLAPGAVLATSVPDGPSFVVVEAGQPVVVVEGDAVALPAGEGSAGRVPVPIGEAITLEVGDRLAFPTATSRTFRNDGPGEVGLLIASLTADGQPSGDEVGEAAGVESESLGQGTAETLPAGAAMTLERLVLVEGSGVPAHDGPVLVAVEAGGFASTIETGDVQLSAAGAPGKPVAADAGEVIAVRPGDALFFPSGMAATPPLSGEGEVVLLRFGLIAIDIGTPEPVAGIAVAAEVRVIEDEVRLRDAPSLDGALVAPLAAGQRLTVTGLPEEGDGLLWYPVSDAADPSLAGFVAADFVEVVAAEPDA